MSDNDYAALAAAFAKAQAAFPTISRDKEVTVQTKAGGSYKFKYAPLDTILSAVRQPLGDNGLSIVQLLDDDTLVTTLLHDSGAMLSGRTPIPTTEGIQAFGSAITYLRRYAIQALLGIAAEEDDDGNQAAGNQATFAPPAGPPDASGAAEHLLGIKSVEGTVKLGTAEAYKLDVRETTDGPAFGFRLEMANGEAIPQVVVQGDPAVVAIAGSGGDPASMVGHWVRVKGKLYSIRAPGRRSFNRLRVSEIETRDWRFPASEPDVTHVPDSGGATSEEPDRPNPPALTPDQEAELDSLPLFSEDPAA